MSACSLGVEQEIVLFYITAVNDDLQNLLQFKLIIYNHHHLLHPKRVFFSVKLDWKFASCMIANYI